MKQITIIFFIFLFISCKSSSPQRLIVKSNLPQILPLIEEFNKNSIDLKVVIETDIDATSWDFVIFKGQTSAKNKTIDLIPYLKTIDSEIFYKDILYSSLENEELPYLPLSFDISGLIYKKERYQNQRIIRIEDFISDRTIKFSPYWDKDFLMWYYLSHIPSFKKENDFFDDTVFHTTAQKTKRMIQNSNDKWNEELFNKKYMHLSPWILLDSNTIEYYFMSFSEYIANDYPYKEKIGFSFLSSNDLVIANENITYIGVNSKTQNKKESLAFLDWVFKSNNQNLYLSNNLKEYGKTSLFLGELSTLVEVSENLLPIHYPKQVLFLPKKESITTVQEIPPLWDSLKEQVFIPLFIESKSQDEDKWNQTHKNLFNQWLKKYKK